MTSYTDLLQQREELERQARELDKQLQAARAQEKQTAIASIKAIMAEHGLTVADLGRVGGGASAKVKGTGSVAPKYRNPATGETWTGRGLKPRWLTAALADGKKIEEFAI